MRRAITYDQNSTKASFQNFFTKSIFDMHKMDLIEAEELHQASSCTITGEDNIRFELYRVSFCNWD